VRGSRYEVTLRGHEILKRVNVRNDPVCAERRFALYCARDRRIGAANDQAAVSRAMVNRAVVKTAAFALLPTVKHSKYRVFPYFSGIQKVG
jgi:hypothetical protein